MPARELGVEVNFLAAVDHAEVQLCADSEGEVEQALHEDQLRHQTICAAPRAINGDLDGDGLRHNVVGNLELTLASVDVEPMLIPVDKGGCPRAVGLFWRCVSKYLRHRCELSSGLL